MTEPGTPVDRTTETVGTLLLEVIGKRNLHTLTTYSRNVQVLVIGLWGTEACRIGQARLKITAGLEKKVHARTEDRILNEIMLVETHTGKQCEHVQIPLILRKGTCNAHILPHVAVVTSHYIVHTVLLELHSTRKGSRGEDAVVHAAGICRTGNPGKVIGLAVCIRVTLRAIVAVTVNMLHRGKERQLVLIGHPADIISDSTAVYDVLGLLGNVTLVRL